MTNKQIQHDRTEALHGMTKIVTMQLFMKMRNKILVESATPAKLNEAGEKLAFELNRSKMGKSLNSEIAYVFFDANFTSKIYEQMSLWGLVGYGAKITAIQANEKLQRTYYADIFPVDEATVSYNTPNNLLMETRVKLKEGKSDGISYGMRIPIYHTTLKDPEGAPTFTIGIEGSKDEHVITLNEAGKLMQLIETKSSDIMWRIANELTGERQNN